MDATNAPRREKVEETRLSIPMNVGRMHQLRLVAAAHDESMARWARRVINKAVAKAASRLPEDPHPAKT
jgi:hypothetical protein